MMNLMLVYFDKNRASRPTPLTNQLAYTKFVQYFFELLTQFLSAAYIVHMMWQCQSRDCYILCICYLATNPTSLHVSNLSYKTTSESLKNCFPGCINAAVVMDRESGESRG